MQANPYLRLTALQKEKGSLLFDVTSRVSQVKQSWETKSLWLQHKELCADFTLRLHRFSWRSEIFIGIEWASLWWLLFLSSITIIIKFVCLTSLTLYLGHKPCHVKKRCRSMPCIALSHFHDLLITLRCGGSPSDICNKVSIRFQHINFIS